MQAPEPQPQGQPGFPLWGQDTYSLQVVEVPAPAAPAGKQSCLQGKSASSSSCDLSKTSPLLSPEHQFRLDSHSEAGIRGRQPKPRPGRLALKVSRNSGQPPPPVLFLSQPHFKDREIEAHKPYHFFNTSGQFLGQSSPSHTRAQPQALGLVCIHPHITLMLISF